MAIRNYRQAKRNREDARKKRQQEKLQRKQTRPGVPEPGQDPVVSNDNVVPKETP